jgi:transposase InsO family protein
MCDVLNVSRSGYYAWTSREESTRSREDADLAIEVERIHDDSRRTYGSPRVHAELRAEGRRVGRKRVERLMREKGLAGRRPKRFKRTTDSNHDLPIAENLLQREFDVDAPDKAWVADITYVATATGWLFLAVILDLFSRRVVGWSMANHMRTELVSDALKMALVNRPEARGTIFHSDRGSQYASHEYRALLAINGLRASMSRKGDCWDNAVAESFFGTLKQELIHQSDLMSQEQARREIFEYIEVFYNRQRLHSHNGHVSPVDFERIASEVA